MSPKNLIVSTLSQTGQKKKIGKRYFYEVLCSICNETKYVVGHDLSRIKHCPVCRDLGNITERIEHRYKIIENTGCFEWTSTRNKDGYAIISTGKKKIRVAKFLLEKKLNRPIAEGFETCHICHNRKCINVDHLYEGTHKQNQEDMAKRGILKGIGYNRKIEAEKASEIKNMLNQGIKNKTISIMLNIPVTVVENIKYGHSWAWL